MANESTSRARFRRIDAAELARALTSEPSTLLLDVRRGEAFVEEPGIPGALPLVLDDEPILIPDTERSRTLVVYCL